MRDIWEGADVSGVLIKSSKDVRKCYQSIKNGKELQLPLRNGSVGGGKARKLRLRYTTLRTEKGEESSEKTGQGL